MGSKRTAWHFFFCILLRRYGPRSFEVRDEVPLSDEPPRMDYLILRRTGEPPADDTAETLHELWPRLPRVSIVELKTLGRAYQKGNLDRLWSYAHAYHADEHASVDGRHNLCAVLVVPSRTPTLEADVEAMGLGWVDLGHGYWRVTGGLFTLYVVDLDVVAEQPDEDLVSSFSHHQTPTPRAVAFWREMAGPEVEMDVREMEGYEEAIQKFLSALPPEQVLSTYTPEQRLAGLPPEQRLAGLSTEQMLLALPDDVLRGFSDDFLATLSDATRDAIRRRTGRS